MLYQEKWPPRPGAAPPEAPKIWGTGAYTTLYLYLYNFRHYT